MAYRHEGTRYTFDVAFTYDQSNPGEAAIVIQIIASNPAF